MAAPRVAITMGDPAGIGPEIVAKAASRLRDRVEAGELTVIVTGKARCLARTSECLGIANPFVRVPSGSLGCSCPPFAILDVGLEASGVRLGQVSKVAGEVAYRAIVAAVHMAMVGKAAAICTAPINKEALNLAGHPYSGHTELLADLTGARDSAMMLVLGDMRVSHVSTHAALAEVPRLLTEPRLCRVVHLTREALLRLGVARPRIGVAALNPHAGEGGLFGREDIDVTAPTLHRLRREGYDVVGPISGDTIFVRARAGEFDAVVAMYHDQGHIPVKLLGFSIDPVSGEWRALSGVNVTLGLPIIRTSVDHGTAFDIAGRGVANEQSLLEAINFALKLACASASTDPAASFKGSTSHSGPSARLASGRLGVSERAVPVEAPLEARTLGNRNGRT